MADKVWTVFVPYQYLISPSGLLLGHLREDFNIVYISNISADRECQCVHPQQCVGVWTNGSTRRDVPEKSVSRSPVCVTLESRTESGMLECIIKYNKQSVVSNCIIFNPTDMLQSYFFNCQFHNEEDIRKLRDSVRITDVLLYEVSRGTTFVKDSNKCLRDKRPKFACEILLKLMCAFQIFGHMLDNRWTKAGILQAVIETPTISNHLVSRKREQSRAVHSYLKESSDELGSLNVVARQLFDTFLGVIVMYVVLQNGWTNSFASYILAWAHNVADELNSLLNWLMGAPAGLKLNRQLTEFLGHFFLYHIYLWKGYLAILEPILGSLLWYILLIGFLGVTAQLCLLQDVISVMTLHIYCFYVYAARLYRFQVYMLAALWRLFRGKKWNVLRHRVDSAFYDIDQLFLGTLLFTMLLFMLPTTTLYYVVFTLLRILVLLVQGILYKAVRIFDSVPIFSIILWIFKSKKVAGDILFNVISKRVGGHVRSIIFSMQITHMSLSRLIHKSHNSFGEQKVSGYSWVKIMADVVRGHLIYPWVKKGQTYLS